MTKSFWIVNYEKYQQPLRFQASESRGKSVKWVRCAIDWMDDVAIVTMPEQIRWLWPAFFALAGASTPPGRVDIDGLALRLRTTEEKVTEAMEHLWKKGLIRYSSRSAKAVA